MTSTLPLVSLVIPAYKADFFAQALASACAQTYPNIEIVVRDDCPTLQVSEAVAAQQGQSPFVIHYYRNPLQRGETPNAVDCIQQAQGKYLKFLHDDDMLHPDCISELVRAMESDAKVAVASSRRARIDEQGNTLPDIVQTSFPFAGDVIINGAELTSFLVDHTLNIVGEPSCYMCRREDLLVYTEHDLTSLNGCVIFWVGDLALCVKLLRGGDLAFLQRPLSYFRVSAVQFSQTGREMIGVGDKGHEDFRRSIRELGWYQPAPQPRLVSVAPLSNPTAVEKVDLMALLMAAYQRRQAAEVLERWIAYRIPSPTQQGFINEYLEQHAPAPVIELIILDLAGDNPALKRTLASVEAVRAHYPALQALVLRDLHHINPMIGYSDATWIMLVQAGDELTAGGLAVAGLELLPGPDCRAVYGDTLWRDAQGNLDAGMRPDFNLDFLLSFPLAMERHWLFRREVVVAAGGFDPNFAQALEFELILRLINEGGMAGLGHIHEPFMISPAPAMQDNPAQRAAIESHLRLRGYEAAVLKSPSPGLYHIDYGHSWQPLVSIVLVMQDDLAAVQRCVMSLFEHTGYGRYEVLIVDNASQLPASRAWLQAMEKMAPERIRVLHLEQPVSHSAALNLGAQQGQGEYLVFFRATVVCEQSPWLGEMLNHGLRQEVAIVGAKTVDGDGAITHAGLILGLNGVAATAFAGAGRSAPGYLWRLQADQNYSAVSDLCLMVRKAVFDEIGGFDSEAFADQGADLDLCLRIAALGYLTVWTPRAVLLQGQAPEPYEDAAQKAVYERWLPLLARDPAYNLNFALHETTSFDLVDSRVNWRPLGWRPLPVVLGHPADPFGAGHYRIIQPFNALKAAGQIEGMLCSGLMHPADLARYTPDSIILQRPVSEGQLPLLQKMKAFSSAFKVYELDDYLPNLPLKSVHRGNFPKDVLRTIRRGLECVDRFVVSTQPLAEAFKGMHPDIRVVPNRLDPAAWGQLPASQRRAGPKPRVGWAGGFGHEGDLGLVLDLVKALAGEVTWVFMGGVPEVLRPFATSFHPGVDLADYPAALAALNLDLALAPLEQNLFNECKSNLRLLEYGICGYPVVCSDIAPYRGLPVTRVRNRFKDWLEAIRAHLADLDGTARLGDELQAVIRRDWMLDERGLADWKAAWLG
ncbi:glycosyltransferase [Pseudomonas sp. dw_358]|uniref:glycosyltransferase n=1 Tax=Pseudomonas sp. dw_358 TaxID=2720083 RepID=UPI001BD66F70|nr:glycosyltransferase [Pseudomonas sp. dw_358]